MGPRDKQLSVDEETVEIVEALEDCPDYSDLDDEQTEIDYVVEELY